MMAVEPRPAQHTLFGLPEPARPARGAVRSPVADGYAAPPGTGPAGESCGSCEHCVKRNAKGKNFYKCQVMVRSWSTDRGTDVLLRSPACQHWTPGTPHASTVRHLHDRTFED